LAYDGECDPSFAKWIPYTFKKTILDAFASYMEGHFHIKPDEMDIIKCLHLVIHRVLNNEPVEAVLLELLSQIRHREGNLTQVIEDWAEYE